MIFNLELEFLKKNWWWKYEYSFFKGIIRGYIFVKERKEIKKMKAMGLVSLGLGLVREFVLGCGLGFAVGFRVKGE